MDTRYSSVTSSSLKRSSVRCPRPYSRRSQSSTAMGTAMPTGRGLPGAASRRPSQRLHRPGAAPSLREARGGAGPNPEAPPPPPGAEERSPPGRFAAPRPPAIGAVRCPPLPAAPPSSRGAGPPRAACGKCGGGRSGASSLPSSVRPSLPLSARSG